MTSSPQWRSARVLFVRHGESTWNAEGRWQGWADPPLSSLGEQQAHDAVEHLLGAGLTRVVTSDLQRARRTGELLAEGLGIATIDVDPDLREHGVGLFQGNTTAENKARFPRAWVGDRVVEIPEAETAQSVVGRVVPALLRAAHRYPDEAIVVVSHGGVLRMLEQHLGVGRDFSMPNLGGRWFEVCEGGRIEAGELLVTVDPEHLTRPVEE